MVSKNYPKKEMVGKQFSHLTVLEEVGERGQTRKFKCQCMCGNVKIVAYGHLAYGHTKSCGCHGKPLRIGDQFTNWTVLAEADRVRGSRIGRKVICQCKCGTIKTIALSELRAQNSKSCGCLNKQQDIKPGTKFNHWTIIEEAGRYKGGATQAKCQCVCGKIRVVRFTNLQSGRSKSCGCRGRILREKR